MRWPEHHVYARVHTDRLGIGSYDHAPAPVQARAHAAGARLAWDGCFNDVITAAQRLLQPAARLVPNERVNGVFAMTPDNMPFLGLQPETQGVWTAQTLWVTHAAGAARALTRTMTDDAPLPAELAVDRFGPLDDASRLELRSAALRLYRDIYANEPA